MSENETAYCKLHGKQEDGSVLVKFVRKYPVILGRTKEEEGEYGHIQIGSSKSISRQHAEIDWNRDSKCFEMKCLGKNGITVDQMLYKAENIAAKLKQNSAIKIGGSRFYFLLPKQKPKARVIDMLEAAAIALAKEDPAYKEKGFTVKELSTWVTSHYEYYTSKEQKSNFERSARTTLNGKRGAEKFTRSEVPTEGKRGNGALFIYKFPSNKQGKKRSASEISEA